MGETNLKVDASGLGPTLEEQLTVVGEQIDELVEELRESKAECDRLRTINRELLTALKEIERKNSEQIAAYPNSFVRDVYEETRDACTTAIKLAEEG